MTDPQGFGSTDTADLEQAIGSGSQPERSREKPATIDGNLEQFLGERIEDDSQDLYAEALEFMERYVLTRVLRMTEGNKSRASRMLGITRGSLRHKLRALGISVGRVVTAGPGPGLPR